MTHTPNPIQSHKTAVLVARAALTAHCLCLKIQTDKPGLLLVHLPPGYAIGAVRVRGMGRAEGYRTVREKLEQVWKESLAWSSVTH